MLLTRIGLFAAFGLIMADGRGRQRRHRVPAASPAGHARPRPARCWSATASCSSRGSSGSWSASASWSGCSPAAPPAVRSTTTWPGGTPPRSASTDPQFGLDISLLRLRLPVVAVRARRSPSPRSAFSAIVAAIVHYTMGGLRFSGARRGASRAAQAHLSILIGLAVLVRGIGYWFDQYGLEISRTNRLFTGITYTADNATVNAKLILAIIAGICALLFFANAVLQRWAVPMIGLILMLLSAIVLGLVYPGAVQYFSVRPNEPDKERPYIERNIDATRAAYGVDKVEITDYSAETTATAGQLQDRRRGAAGHPADRPERGRPGVRAAAAGPRLLLLPEDPRRRPLHHRRQGDRRGGRGPRDGPVAASRARTGTTCRPSTPTATAWWPRTATAGRPAASRSGSSRTSRRPGRSPSTSRGSTSVSCRAPDEYSIVGAPAGSPPIELDTPGGGEGGNPKTFTYTGKGGVPIGSLWQPGAVRGEVRRRQHPAVRPGERRRPRSSTTARRGSGCRRRRLAEGRRRRLPGRRRGPDRVDRRRLHHVELLPEQRAGQPQPGHLGRADQRRAAPWWPSRRTTSTTCATRSRPWSTPTTERSSSTPGTRPTRCCRPGGRRSPDVVLNKDEISADLLDHLRYPQDLFKVQRQILASYHMTDPDNWYSKSNLWEVPNDPVAGRPTAGQGDAVLPVGEVAGGSETDLLADHRRTCRGVGRTWPPTWRSTPTRAVRTTAGCGSCSMSDTTQIDGPGQTFNAMITNETVADRLRPFLNQGAADATFGNLLTLPVGGGLLYVTAGLHPAAGQHRLLSGPAVRDGPVRSVGRHRRHPAGRRWTRCSRATPAPRPTRASRATERAADHRRDRTTRPRPRR